MNWIIVRGMNEDAPALPEFGSSEQAAAYDKWFREKVARSLADPRPSIPHGEVMAEMRTIIDEAAGKEC
jgi:hypothetical protein